MGEEQRRAAAALIAADDSFKTAMASAKSIGDAVRIARERGIELSVEDFGAPSEAALGDAELESASGAGMPMPEFRTLNYDCAIRQTYLPGTC